MATINLGNLGIRIGLDGDGEPSSIDITHSDGTTETQPFGDGEFDVHHALKIIVATGGNRFVPTSLPSIQRWYDPSDAATVTASGGAVSALADKSGVNLHLSQSTESRKPTTGGTINGKPALTYDGSDDFLLTSGGTAAHSGSDKPYTAFLVVEPADASVTNYIMCFNSSSSATPFNAIRIGISGGPLWQMVKRDDASAAKTSSSVAQVTEVPHIITAITNGTTATVRVDGVEVISGADLDAGTTTLDRFALGAFFGSTTILNPFNGKIGEVIMCTEALGISRVQAAESYLGAKWGITV